MDIVVDKDGHSSKLDEMSKQQIYFLTVEPDDFSEILKRPSTSERIFETWPKSQYQFFLFLKGSVVESAGEPRGDQDQEPAESPGSRRPFQFSDFKKQPVRPESPNVSDCSGGRKDSASALPGDDPDDDVFKSASEQEEVA